MCVPPAPAAPLCPAELHLRRLGAHALGFGRRSSVPTPPAGLGGRGEQAEALDFTDVPTGADGTPGGRSARGDALDPQSLGWAVGPAVSASEALARETDVAWEDTMRRAQEWEARNLHQGERAGWKSNPRTAWGGESKVELA